MKQYNKYNKFYNLGVNSYKNNIHYFLHCRYHGLYYYSCLINDNNNDNNELHICKGYSNKGILYSHWENHYTEEFIYKYYL